MYYLIITDGDISEYGHSTEERDDELCEKEGYMAIDRDTHDLLTACGGYIEYGIGKLRELQYKIEKNFPSED